MHAFSRGTLTEDSEILELIQSWKQTPRGQCLGGDLAVALAWLGVGWEVAGGGTGSGGAALLGLVSQ